MLRTLLLLVMVLLPAFRATAADPEPRVALVIGNAAYADGALRNPVNDAREMARTLRGLGFTVLAHENLGRQAMEQASVHGISGAASGVQHGRMGQSAVSHRTPAAGGRAGAKC